MGTHSIRQSLLAQLVEARKLYDSVREHPLMSVSFGLKVTQLENKLAEIPEDVKESKVQLLFSGTAVVGSEGIKTSFLSKIINPFQELIKEQEAIIDHRNQKLPIGSKRKGKTNSNLYLTALPTGSFGVELSHLEHNDLFNQDNVANSINETIDIIKNISNNDLEIEDIIENNSNTYIENLKKFLEPIKKHHSIVKLESGTNYLELSKDDVILTHERIGSIVQETEPIIINGIFKGFLLQSNKFEILDEKGKVLNGKISKEISEEKEIELVDNFLNQECTIHLLKHSKVFASGKELVQYELINIT